MTLNLEGSLQLVRPEKSFPISVKFGTYIEVDEWCTTVCRMTRSKVKVTNNWQPLKRSRPSVLHEAKFSDELCNFCCVYFSFKTSSVRYCRVSWWCFIKTRFTPFLVWHHFHLAVLLLRTHTHTTVLRPFFWDHPGEPVPEENFWTLWCKT